MVKFSKIYTKRRQIISAFGDENQRFPAVLRFPSKTAGDGSSNLPGAIFYWFVVGGLWLVVLMCLSLVMAPIGTKRNHAVVWSKNINRNFSEEELEKFFSCVSNEKHLMCYKLQAYLGLRISEAVKVNLSDIDFNRRKIKVWGMKTKELDFLHLHEKVFESVQKWVRIHAKEIKEHQGFLIFSDHKTGHISKDRMRNYFRAYLKKTKLDDCYVEISTVGKQCLGKSPSRKLRRLSTHSLRHYYVTKVYKETMNPVVTQKCARHRSFKSTSCYINIDSKDCIDALDRTFGNKQTTNQKPETNELEDFVKMFKAWKAVNLLKNFYQKVIFTKAKSCKCFLNKFPF